MIRVAVLGDIGSGKSFLASSFGYPVFNADLVVSSLYKKNKLLFNKLKKIFPKKINSFPINKNNVMDVIKSNPKNLLKVVKIVHPLVRKEMNIFLKKNKSKKMVILDIPLLLENKLNLKTDILVFVDANKKIILQKLKKRKNFNLQIYKLFKNIQLPLETKKNMADFVIKNNFNSAKLKKEAKNLTSKILL